VGAPPRRPGWLPPHISYMCGSYIWVAWVLPTVVGSPLIARVAARYALAARKPTPVGTG
jgi:hypothetical protein